MTALQMLDKAARAPSAPFMTLALVLNAEDNPETS
jgi:hypothetical protein